MTARQGIARQGSLRRGRCRMRDCRKTGNCMSRLTSLEDIGCHGGLSDAGERGVHGMILLLAQLGAPDKRFLL